MKSRTLEEIETQDGSSDISTSKNHREPIVSGLTALGVGIWIYYAQIVPNHQPLMHLAAKTSEYVSNTIIYEYVSNLL